MESISVERWSDLIDGATEVLKLELRDYYGSDAELFGAWESGELAAVATSYENWLDFFKSAYIDAGRTFRRVRVVSEPLSPYQQMAVAYSGITVEVGEDLRWLPRRLVSTIALPGNDCLILDGHAAVFNVMDSDGSEIVERQLHTDHDAVKFCQEAFEAAWSLATPHEEYRAQKATA